MDVLRVIDPVASAADVGFIEGLHFRIVYYDGGYRWQETPAGYGQGCMQGQEKCSVSAINARRCAIFSLNVIYRRANGEGARQAAFKAYPDGSEQLTLL